MKYLYIILLFFPLFFSCTHKIEKNKFLECNFKTFEDSIVPSKKMKSKGFLTFNMIIKGYTNDFISVKINNYDDEIFLHDSIYKRIYFDFLGKESIKIKVKNLNCTKGKLYLKYGIYK